MAKSIQELLALQKAARAVPIRNVSAIDWSAIVRKLNAGETLTFKTDCKFALPKNSADLLKHLQEHGYTGDVKVKHPIAEVVVLEPASTTVTISAEMPKVERSGRDAVVTPIKRGPGRPRKNPLAAMGGR